MRPSHVRSSQELQIRSIHLFSRLCLQSNYSGTGGFSRTIQCPIKALKKNKKKIGCHLNCISMLMTKWVQNSIIKCLNREEKLEAKQFFGKKFCNADELQMPSVHRCTRHSMYHMELWRQASKQISDGLLEFIHRIQITDNNCVIITITTNVCNQTTLTTFHRSPIPWEAWHSRPGCVILHKNSICISLRKTETMYMNTFHFRQQWQDKHRNTEAIDKLYGNKHCSQERRFRVQKLCFR